MRIIRGLLAVFGLGCMLLLIFIYLVARNQEPPAHADAPISGPESAIARAPQALDPTAELIYEPAKDPSGPSRIPMIAVSLNAAPGAIVCPSMNLVGVLFDQYSEAWGEHFSNAETGGGYEKVNGKPMDAPDPVSYGCEVLKPGTRVMAINVNMMPDLVAVLPNGDKIRGVTLESMLAAPISPDAMNPGTMDLPVDNPSPYLVQEWALTNDWIRARCSSSIEDEVSDCIAKQTKLWMYIHPDVNSVPWMKTTP